MRTAARLRLMYTYFCLLPVFLIIFGETGGEWVGSLAGDVRLVYFAEALTILLTAVCVPLSLKLFAWVRDKKMTEVMIPEALRMYLLWSGIRLAMLAIPVLVGFITYYLTMSHTGVLCGLIAVTASLFCVPGERRLRKELDITFDKNGE